MACKHVGKKDAQGNVWCNKKNRYVHQDASTEENCEFFEAA
jgi:hypothetical protein